MSTLTFFDLDNLPAPREGRPAPDRFADGRPTWKTWNIAQSSDGGIRSGIREVTPGAYRSTKDTSFEFCRVLSGMSELSEDGKESRRITAGDTFVMHPGFNGVWRVIEATRKLRVCRD